MSQMHYFAGALLEPSYAELGSGLPLFTEKTRGRVFSETRTAPVLFPKTPEDLGRAGALSFLRLSSRSALMRRVFANGGI
jgi:hypothetical protein